METKPGNAVPYTPAYSDEIKKTLFEELCSIDCSKVAPFRLEHYRHNVTNTQHKDPNGIKDKTS